MSIKNIIEEKAETLGISVSPDLIEKLEVYAKELKEWNEKINLTAITDDEGITVKHFIDLVFYNYLMKCFVLVDLKTGKITHQENSKIIDVGTGAGFPGLVIAAARPDVKVTLLDSTGKKLKVVNDIGEKMGLLNYEILNMRAEEAGQKKEYRELYDFATARAVASMPVLSEYCMPYVKKGGRFVALKSVNEEIRESENAIKLLGGKKAVQMDYSICNGDNRRLFVIEKIVHYSAGLFLLHRIWTMMVSYI